MTKSTVKKNSVKSNSAVTAPTYSNDEMTRRAIALQASAQLVSNPVHAFAATPQNVMMLANTFWHFIEGKEIPAETVQKPQVVTPETSAAAPATPQVYS